MEKTSSNTFLPSFLLADILEFFLLQGVLNWVIRIQKYYSSSRCFFIGISKGRTERTFTNSESFNGKSSLSEKADDGKLAREDVEMVMRKLRIACNPNEERLQE
ncbi:hypothetical protein GIB67_023327 [Kingdonia uniflora]|uniref:Uncharacterized protein n=1 Tax=Kingdonia uniflora TaxID=39325 RepID=A0A7J7NF52_9MAGN|nr:hypothetical protein GIB67_023327 [Kingdonia uniflora]